MWKFLVQFIYKMGNARIGFLVWFWLNYFCILSLFNANSSVFCPTLVPSFLLRTESYLVDLKALLSMYVSLLSWGSYRDSWCSQKFSAHSLLMLRRMVELWIIELTVFMQDHLSQPPIFNQMNDIHAEHDDKDQDPKIFPFQYFIILMAKIFILYLLNFQHLSLCHSLTQN